MALQAVHRRHALLKHTHVSADITDLSLTAADVTYDNTTSGLAATDVQAAIDEVVAEAGGGGFPPQLAWAGVR